MTPTEYEARCAQMLRANAHNMNADEIERLAYGTGDPAMQILSAQNAEMVYAAHEDDSDAAQHIADWGRAFLR